MKLAAVILIVIATVHVAHHWGEPAHPLLIHADYQLCANQKRTPLLRTPQGNYDKRLNPHAFNDSGET